MVTCSVSAQTSRDIIQAHAETPCAGYSREKWFGILFSQHLFILKPLCRSDKVTMPRRFCEAAGKWKSSIIAALRFLTQPASTGHRASCCKGDRDRQLTKNNMCLTQPRKKEKILGRNGRRNGKGNLWGYLSRGDEGYFVCRHKRMQRVQPACSDTYTLVKDHNGKT